MNLGDATQRKVDEVVGACKRSGHNSVVVLSGVPGTGKSFVAMHAAQAHAGHPLFVREVQFHQSYTYEDFVEGLRPTQEGGFAVEQGLFLELNDWALSDPDNKYVLLIEEMSRANIPAVIGELMTYVEHRDRFFLTPVSRKSVRIASNLTILATINPQDRSALEIDDALVRRLRIIDCPPDKEQLREMLTNTLQMDDAGKSAVIDKLEELFDRCKGEYPDTYDRLMPFGHGMFADARDLHDLQRLWAERIVHLLRRNQLAPHPYTKTIAACYPTAEPVVDDGGTPQIE